MSYPASQPARGSARLQEDKDVIDNREQGSEMQGEKNTTRKAKRLRDGETEWRRGTQMVGRGGRTGGRRQRDGVEVDALDVFLLFHQQKPVGGKVQ